MKSTLDPKRDLQDASDIRTLVDTFYSKIQNDPLLAPVFRDVAEVDWAHHLSVMYSFWEMILFRTQGYEGNPFLKHVPLPIQQEHFQRWLALFTGTLDELFSGAKAEEAKGWANKIAGVFQMRLGIAKLDDPLSCRLS